MTTTQATGENFDGKTALITGGSKGIGEGCARVFVGAGWKVLICARGEEAGEADAVERVIEDVANKKMSGVKTLVVNEAAGD